MPGSIGGFPVHNYGSDPLGRMGMEMFKSSLDWDEKQKILERQAVTEAAKQQKDIYLKSAEAGTAIPGVGVQLFGREVGGGIEALNEQKRMQAEQTRILNVIKISTDQQNYDEKQIKLLEDAQEKAIKRKMELMDAGGNEDMVVYMNDQLKAMDANISKLRGFDVGSSVVSSDLSSWKKTRQEEAVKEIAILTKNLQSAIGSNNPDTEEIASASGKLGAAILLNKQKYGFTKEDFTLQAELLKQAESKTGEVMAARVKPPPVPTPTNEDKAILDRLATLGLEDTRQNRDRVRTILANEPNKSRETALVSNTAFISQVLKIPKEEALKLAMGTKDSEGTVSDINKLGTMLESLTNDKNPPEWKLSLIKKTAEKLGWNLVKVPAKEEPGRYFGTKWTTKTEEGYSLEPKKGKDAITNQEPEVTATNPKTGQKIKWDGTKWVPVK
jgi:hypothetical protein